MYPKSLLVALFGALIFGELAQAMCTDGEDSVALVEQAQSLATTGYYQDSIVSYREALDQTPADTNLTLVLAQLLRDTGTPTKAIDVLDVAINNSAINDSRLHLLYGELIEDTSLTNAREQYHLAIDTDPASRAAVDAVANLDALDKTTDESNSSISWTKIQGSRKLAELGHRIEGEWCLELVDIYHREAGMCMSEPTAGDLVTVANHPQISLKIDERQKKLIAKNLDVVTEIALPNNAIESVEVSVGDRYEVHTVTFPSNDYLEFNLSDGKNQCFQVQQRKRDSEHLLCTNAYTFCRCGQ